MLPCVRRVRAEGMIQSVLTVCLGNICRSPVAQVLLSHRLPGLVVASAGLQALDGRDIDPPMRQLLQADGVQPPPHQARTLMSWMLMQASLVLVMDTQQKAHIEQHYPAARGRVFRLLDTGVAGAGQDIPDPYLRDSLAYERAYQLIDAGVQGWSTRIRSIGYACS